MYRQCWIKILVAIMVSPVFSHAENLEKEIKKAVERSTLDQTGTRPFHLKATLAPSFERDKDSGQTGEIEIWWASPTQWKRELQSPGFHRIEIIDGGHNWQKNEGDYFPEWLQEIALELIKPIPPLDDVLTHVKDAEVRRIGPMTNVNWITNTGTAEVHNIQRSWVALRNSTGLLLYAGGLGWGGEFKDYSDFHGRKVPRKVSEGSPEVTARVVTLEDLGSTPPNFFDAKGPGGDALPLQTTPIDETTLRNNLLSMDPPTWPALREGPLRGNFTTWIVVDRNGKVRDIGVTVAENQGVYEAGKRAVQSMRFKPFVIDGVPVQVLSQVTVPFKIVPPAPTH